MDENINTSHLRKLKYKNLLERGEEIKNSTNNDFEKISEVDSIVKEANEILHEGHVSERVSSSTEVVMDAQVVKMSHELLGDIIKNTTDSQFSDEEYINAIRKLITKNDEETWYDFENIAGMASHAVYIPTFYNLKFSNEISTKEKVAKQSQRRSKNTLGIEKKPENVKEIEKVDEGAKKVSIAAKQIRDLYMKNGNKSIPFYHLVIDPNDFMNTIDNIFQIAFLIRDDKIILDIGDDNNPAVRPVTNSDKLKRENINSSIQDICTIDVELSERMVSFYNITEPLLKLT